MPRGPTPAATRGFGFASPLVIGDSPLSEGLNLGSRRGFGYASPLVICDSLLSHEVLSAWRLGPEASIAAPPSASTPSALPAACRVRLRLPSSARSHPAGTGGPCTRASPRSLEDPVRGLGSRA